MLSSTRCGRLFAISKLQSRRCIVPRTAGRFGALSDLSRGKQEQVTFEIGGQEITEKRKELLRFEKSIPPELLSEQKLSTIEFKHSNDSYSFDLLWLRDHCRCPECFHPITKQRMLDTFGIPMNIHVTNERYTDAGVEITWSHGEHKSFYPWEWLRRYGGNDTPSMIAMKYTWGEEIAVGPPDVQYKDVMHDDKFVFDWLSKVDKYGFCFVRGVPPTPEATEMLARRIGFIKETQYGTFWDFSSDLAHGDTAYTDVALPAHTDTTYFADPCGLQLFHLLQPSPMGGHTLLVDGFHVATQLHSANRLYFDMLSTVKIPTHSAGSDGIFYFTGEGKPVIEINDRGELQSVRWNNNDRSALKVGPSGKIREWYHAIYKWNELLTLKKNEYWISLGPGTAVVIDNHRVLHGRSEVSGPRRMCGAYIGTDEYRSRLMALREKYGGIRPGEKRGVWNVGL